MNVMIKAYRVMKGFTEELNNNHVGAYASSAAFFIFISLIPCVMLLLTIIPYTPVSKADILSVAVNFLPDSIDGLAINIIDELYGKSPAIISITAIATMWSAGKGVLAITRGLNSVYDVNETRNYIMLRIRSAFYIVVLIVAVVLCLLVMVFSNSLQELLVKNFEYFSKIFGVVHNFRFMLTLSLLTLMFMALYEWIPNRKASFVSQLPGAVFSSVVWSCFSFGFSIYIDYFHGFSMYGSLTTVIIVMLWLYFCMSIMLLGAQINAYFEPAFVYFHNKHKKKIFRT